MIDPDSVGRDVWDWVVIVFVLWTAFAIPLMVAWDWLPPMGAMVVVNIVFLADLVVHFRTGYLNEAREPVMDPRMVRVPARSLATPAKHASPNARTADR